LHDAGVSVPFAANAGTLEKWTGNAPLVLLDVAEFTAEEIATLQKLRARGVRLVAFQGPRDLSQEAAVLFGVTTHGEPAQGKVTTTFAGKPVIAGEGTLLLGARSEELVRLSDSTQPEAHAMLALLRRTLDLPVSFPAGTAGYGFVSQGKSFIVVEDWREEGRTVSLRLKAREVATQARAVNINNHETLTVKRDGNEWVIELPIGPGDGALVSVEEL
jgi:hypothetical protein